MTRTSSMKLRAIIWKEDASVWYCPLKATDDDIIEAQRLVQKSGRVRLIQENIVSLRWVVLPWDACQ